MANDLYFKLIYTWAFISLEYLGAHKVWYSRHVLFIPHLFMYLYADVHQIYRNLHNFLHIVTFFMAGISTNEQIAIIIVLEVFVNCRFFVVVGLL